MISLPIVMAVAVLSVETPGPDGMQLLRACTAALDQVDRKGVAADQMVQGIWCMGYLSGLLDGLAVMSWKGGAIRVCMPERGVENEQALRIVVKYLREHPESLHESARSLAVSAIAEAFPCK